MYIRDVPDSSKYVADIRFRLAEYPAIFTIRFWPNLCQIPDILAGYFVDSMI